MERARFGLTTQSGSTSLSSLPSSPTAFIKVKVLSGLFKNFTNLGTQPAVDKFAYHVHQKPLTNGSFASAQAHLDTLNLTEGYIADPAL